LGFKSVFGATDSPYIMSRAWQFMFKVDSKADAVANYITPRWVEKLPDELLEAKRIMPHYTHFWLPFKVQSTWSSEQGNTLLEATDEHLLLNMRKLRCFVVRDRRQLGSVGHIRHVRLEPGKREVVAKNEDWGAGLQIREVTSCEVQLIVDGALSNIAITGANGTFSCSSTSLAVGQSVIISGLIGGTGSIFGYTHSSTYYVVALARTGSYVTGFTLSASSGGSAILTTPGTPTGLTFTKSKLFRQFQCEIKVPEDIRFDESSAARRNVETTVLTLTFPSLGRSEVSEYDTFPVYATLPICNLGFRFLLNCDWIVVTNRESVRDNRFNTFLRNATAAFFVYVGVHDSELKKYFHSFVPSSKIDSSWWLGLVNDIKTRLLNHLCSSQRATFLPNLEVQSLFMSYSRRVEEILDISILSEETCQLLSQDDLKRMGRQSLSIIQVFECFKNDLAFASWTRLQNPTWWEALFCLLNKECDIEDSNGLNRLNILEGKSTLFRAALNAPIFAERSFKPAPGQNGARGPLRSRLCYYSPQSHTELWRQELVYLHHSSSAELKFIERFALVLTPTLICELIFDLHLENRAATIGGALEVWRDL